MSQVLAMVAHEHDVVIIDSPPVMPVSDALLLATVVDGVVLVVNSLKTSKHHVKMTCAKLEYARAKIFGVLPQRDRHQASGLRALLALTTITTRGLIPTSKCVQGFQRSGQRLASGFDQPAPLE